MSERVLMMVMVGFQVVAILGALYAAGAAYRQRRLPVGRAGYADYCRLANHALVGGIVGAAAMFIGTGVGLTLL